VKSEGSGSKADLEVCARPRERVRREPGEAAIMENLERPRGEDRDNVCQDRAKKRGTIERSEEEELALDREGERDIIEHGGPRHRRLRG
jgi:hypothetical protein